MPDSCTFAEIIEGLAFCARDTASISIGSGEYARNLRFGDLSDTNTLDWDTLYSAVLTRMCTSRPTGQSGDNNLLGTTLVHRTDVRAGLEPDVSSSSKLPHLLLASLIGGAADES